MKKTYFAIGLAIVLTAISILAACKKNEISAPAGIAKAQMDTITDLANMKSDIAIWNDNGQYRLVKKVTAEEEDNDAVFKTSSTSCPTAYSGSARATAKTSFATVATTTYSSFSAVRSSVPSDTYMRGLALGNGSARTTQENKNINLTSAYLYAISRESDEDLHMIIGDASAGTLTNCESSGYPSRSSSAYVSIKSVRDSITKRFGTDFCGTSGYTTFSPPVHLTGFQGSLFYDIDHAPGTVGPSAYRPSSSWEVHPLKFLKFH